MQLLLGCGYNRIKKVFLPGAEPWVNLTTLDCNFAVKPDIIHDLTDIPLPLPDNSCSEIHAYEVMEHVGQQGDWRFFFDQWKDMWRLLEPGGVFIGTSPMYNSEWAWGDPGHTRIISAQCLTFLNQPEYEKQQGKTAMTEYRTCYSGDFEPLHLAEANEAPGTFVYILRAIKPPRIKYENQTQD